MYILNNPIEDRLLYFRRWFIRMRWVACVIAAFLIIMTVKFLNYLEEKTFIPLMILLGCLVCTNVLYTLCLRRGWLILYLAEIGIFTDLILLTAMLHFSGGIENPMSFIYIFHIIIGGILLNRRKCYAIVVMASLFISGLALVEMMEILEHYTLLVFPHPSLGSEEEGHLFHAARQPIFVTSLMVLQFILMFLTAYFTTTIMERLRIEEAHAHADRQRLERVVKSTGAGLTILD